MPLSSAASGSSVPSAPGASRRSRGGRRQQQAEEDDEERDDDRRDLGVLAERGEHVGAAAVMAPAMTTRPSSVLRRASAMRRALTARSRPVGPRRSWSRRSWSARRRLVVVGAVGRVGRVARLGRGASSSVVGRRWRALVVASEDGDRDRARRRAMTTTSAAGEADEELLGGAPVGGSVAPRSAVRPRGWQGHGRAERCRLVDLGHQRWERRWSVGDADLPGDVGVDRDRRRGERCGDRRPRRRRARRRRRPSMLSRPPPRLAIAHELVGQRPADRAMLATATAISSSSTSSTRAVAAEHEAVAAHERQRPRVDAHARLDAEGTGDDVAARVRPRLGLRDVAGGDELLDVAVVDGDPPQRAAAVEVGTASRRR